VLQIRAHPSQQKLFDLLGTHCPLPSPDFFKFMAFFSFIPVWNTSRGMGAISPSNSTVINLCAISFLLNHDPDLRISPRHCSRLVPLQEGQRAIQPQARRLCDQALSGPPPPPTQPPTALGLRRRRKTRRLCSRTTRVVLSSSRRSGATAIRRRHLDRGDVAIRRPGVGHTPSKTSRLQSAAFRCRASPLPSSTPVTVRVSPSRGYCKRSCSTLLFAARS
jgi:hypothetical protein